MCVDALKWEPYQNKGLTMKQSLILTYNLKFSLSHVAWPLPIIKQEANAIMKYRSGLARAHKKNKINGQSQIYILYSPFAFGLFLCVVIV